MKMNIPSKPFALMLIAACCIWAASGRHCAAEEGTEGASAIIRLDTSKVTASGRSLLLGNNVQWTDSADGLYDAETRSFDPRTMAFLKTLRITSLRFPGGSLSDAYHWADAIGPPEDRKAGFHVYSRQKQLQPFGTDEFLRLCREFKAEPVMTVNVLTGTAEEAAKWVRYCNKEQPGRVRYWEIGNEPYLNEPSRHNNYHRGYEEIFIRKFIEFSRKMKKEDPSILVGLPLLGRTPHSDYYTDWNSKVWPGCAPDADFVSIHHAYYPVIQKKEDFRDPESFVSLMAASHEVRRDTERIKKSLSDTYPQKRVPLAVTEYNCFFSQPAHFFAKYTASMAASLYVASVLSDLYQDPQILMANFWSLTRNWLFGMTNFSEEPRPQGYVFKIFSDYARDSVIESGISNNPVFDNEAAGYVPAGRNNEALSVLATMDDEAVYLILINRSLSADVPVSVDWVQPVKTRARVVQGHILTAESMASTNEESETVSLNAVDLGQYQDLSSLKVPKHSILGLKISHE